MEEQMKHRLKTDIGNDCSDPCLIRAYPWLVPLRLCAKQGTFLLVDNTPTPATP